MSDRLLIMADYVKKYGLTSSSFYHWLKRGRIGQKGIEPWGVKTVATYVDAPPIQADEIIGAKKWSFGEEVEAYSVEELMHKLDLRRRNHVTELVKRFGDKHPEAVVNFVYFPEAVNPQLGVLSGYLPVFEDFIGMASSKVITLQDNLRVRVDARVLAEMYPYNIAERVLVKPEVPIDILHNVNAQRLLELIDKLPSENKDFLEDYFLKGLTYEEMGEHRGLARGSVHFQVSQSLLGIYNCREVFLLTEGYRDVDDVEAKGALLRYQKKEGDQ